MQSLISHHNIVSGINVCSSSKYACGFFGRLLVLVLVTQLVSTAKAAVITFADVSPILKSRCVMCHAGPAAPLGLHLDTLEGLIAGSDNGVVVESRNSSGSELVHRLNGDRLPRMPMTGPPYLSDEEVNLFARWIDAGLLPAPDEATVDVDQHAIAAVIPADDGPVTYQQVAVILATRCAKCHTGKGLMGPAPEGYKLTSYAETVLAEDRARVVPGQPLASELVRRIRGQSRPRMPFDGPPYLSEREILAIEAWVADGARDSTGMPATMPVGRRVRLHGVLDQQWRLDGLALEVSPATRMDKNPAPGDYVRVRGRLGENGSITAERIRRR